MNFGATLTILLAAVVTRSAPPVDLELRVGYLSETGSTPRALTGFLGSLSPHQHITADLGLQISSLHHCGISAYSAGTRLLISPRSEISLATALQHQQWNDWQAGENRLLAVFSLKPHPRLNLGMGLCYRVPVTDSGRYCQPFIFSSPAAEWNILYSFNWRLWQHAEWSLAASLANSEQFQFSNPQQVPLAATAEWSLRPELLLWARLRTAITGLSALLISCSELGIDIGARFSYGR